MVHDDDRLGRGVGGHGGGQVQAACPYRASACRAKAGPGEVGARRLTGEGEIETCPEGEACREAHAAHRCLS